MIVGWWSLLVADMGLHIILSRVVFPIYRGDQLWLWQSLYVCGRVYVEASTTATFDAGDHKHTSITAFHLVKYPCVACSLIH